MFCERNSDFLSAEILSELTNAGKSSILILKIPLVREIAGRNVPAGDGKMDERQIEANVRRIKAELSSGNAFGERVTLVAATKTQSPESINAAIRGGADVVAENKPQEFRDKNEFVLPCPRHFIGRLQTNKVKYLVGKISLFHSCDRDELAAELAKQSLARGIVSDVLVQINAGREPTKGGYLPESAYETYLRLKETSGLRVRGFMAMLPESTDTGLLTELADEMRALYDRAAKEDGNVSFLSMGMSGDYRLCVRRGSNMVRIGSTIFGERDYGRV